MNPREIKDYFSFAFLKFYQIAFSFNFTFFPLPFRRPLDSSHSRMRYGMDIKDRLLLMVFIYAFLLTVLTKRIENGDFYRQK